MKKIQITTVSTTAEVQMIAPNTYFITKAVKALFALKHIEENIKEEEKYAEDHNRKDPKYVEMSVNALRDDIQPALDFLDELLAAMEGE